MIQVTITDAGKVLGELRIENLTGVSTDGVFDFSVEFAADNGGDIVDLRRRVLYGFNLGKYNALALVSEALNLLELKEMEWDVAPDRPADMARKERGAGRSLPRQALDQVRHYGSSLWRR